MEVREPHGKRQRGEHNAELRDIPSEIRQRFAELKKMLRDFQAEFLEAFCSYAQRNDERIGAVERDLAAMKNGLDVIESRTTEVERRLNTPPQA